MLPVTCYKFLSDSNIFYDIMLTHYRKPISLSMISTDLPVWSVLETAGTLYQKDTHIFHLLLTAPPIINCELGSYLHPKDHISPSPENKPNSPPSSPRLLWLEIYPSRVIMNMQGNSEVSYRHCWERGVYGKSRFWLPYECLQVQQPIHLRNFTRSLDIQGKYFPEHLRLEYELWSGKLQLGRYILNLEIDS